MLINTFPIPELGVELAVKFTFPDSENPLQKWDLRIHYCYCILLHKPLLLSMTLKIILV